MFDTEIDADRLLFTQCCFSPGRATALQVAGPDGSGVADIGDYPTNSEIVAFKFPTPIVKFADDRYAVLMANGGFGFGADPGDSSGGLFIMTNTIGAADITWGELGQTPQYACGAQVAIPASTPSTPTFFVQVGVQSTVAAQPFGCSALTGDQVWKYSGLSTSGTWDRIDDNAGPGGFSLFAVNPSNPNAMYASRGGSTPRMVFSTDGGITWQSDSELNALMTGDGDFLHAHATGNLQPTLLAFDPEDPNTIVAGAYDAGVFLSTNGGDDWTILTDPRTPHLSDVAHLPQPRFAYFDHEPSQPTRIFIGTRGRGAWRLTPANADLRITKTASPERPWPATSSSTRSPSPTTGLTTHLT